MLAYLPFAAWSTTKSARRTPKDRYILKASRNERINCPWIDYFYIDLTNRGRIALEDWVCSDLTPSVVLILQWKSSKMPSLEYKLWTFNIRFFKIYAILNWTINWNNVNRSGGVRGRDICLRLLKLLFFGTCVIQWFGILCE